LKTRPTAQVGSEGRRKPPNSRPPSTPDLAAAAAADEMLLLRGLLLAALLAVARSPLASASESDHKYKISEPVKLWVNKVGPYNNPQETYNYYSLPFCQPAENPAHKWGGLGEVLGGNELIDSQIDIQFLKNVDKGPICTIELDAKKVQQFTDAIESSYWFELFIGTKIRIWLIVLCWLIFFLFWM
uniref:Transmembrane 9 superfamily member n=1 Tax=Aegilops tauschii subsp. strangulata TaxID=200361 RepID=A0A453HIF0_AEGTS